MRCGTTTRWLIVLALLVPACGGAGEDSAMGTIGPEGGTVETPQGASLSVPAGALDEKILFEITLTNSEPEDLPAGLTVVSRMAEIRPSGTLFKVPATITLPWDPADRPAEHEADSVIVYAGPGAQAPWESVPTTVLESSLTAEITHLTKHVGASGCGALGNGCDLARGLHCCSPTKCIGGKCSACRKAGEPGATGDCCNGLFSEDGICRACKGHGGSCDSSGVGCCGTMTSACIGGLCTACLPEGTACTGTTCCGSMKCVNGVCFDGCGKVGDSCPSFTSCCGWATSAQTSCVGGVCTACSGIGGTCVEGWNGPDCCPGGFCDDGKCVPCGDTGAKCAILTECCNHQCENGSCVSCFRERAACKAPSDCCTGICEANYCDSCPSLGTVCSKKADCCPGKCCEGLSVDCHGGMCRDCKLGGDFCWKPEDCCSKQCVEDLCADCPKPGTSCTSEKDCCPGGCCVGLKRACFQGTCWACQAEDTICDDPTDCCSGQCDDIKCAGCPKAGAACKTSGDCCPGYCCSDEKRICFEDTCQACVLEGTACDIDKDCCGAIPCLGDICQVCRKLDETCDPNVPGHCCTGGKCEDGVCEECITEGEECDDEYPCCDSPCQGGFCQGCVPEGDPCEEGNVCCVGECKDKKCYKCPGVGEACNAENPCCGEGLGCKGDVCEVVCGVPGHPCGQAGLPPCCTPGECQANICTLPCGQQDAECDGENPCCEGLTCVGKLCDSDANIAAKEALCEKAWDQYKKCAFGPQSEAVYLQNCHAWYDQKKASMPDNCFQAAMAIHGCAYGVTCAEYNAGALACQGLRDDYPAGCPPF